MIWEGGGETECDHALKATGWFGVVSERYSRVHVFRSARQKDTWC